MDKVICMIDDRRCSMNHFGMCDLPINECEYQRKMRKNEIP